MNNQFKYLYPMTHYRNLQGIMQEGILSHKLSRQYNMTSADISSPVVQMYRGRKKESVYQRLIHDYVPFYLNPKNPMLYARQYIQHALVILCVSTDVLGNYQYVFTNGNAASKETAFSTDERILDSCREVLSAADWNDYPDGKRKRCAEVLVFPKLESDHIQKVICQNEMVMQIAAVIARKESVIDPNFYFQEDNRWPSTLLKATSSQPGVRPS